MATLKICLLEYIQLDTAKMSSMARHELSSGQEACSINFQAKEFPSFYSLEDQWRKEHGAKPPKPRDTVTELNKTEEEEGEDAEKLKEELSACQFFLVDTDMKN